MVGDRIKELRDRIDKSQKQFAKDMKTSQSFISDIERGKSKLSYKLIKKIGEDYMINLNWLVLDEGSMFRVDSSDKNLEALNKKLGKINVKSLVKNIGLDKGNDKPVADISDLQSDNHKLVTEVNRLKNLLLKKQQKIEDLQDKLIE